MASILLGASTSLFTSDDLSLVTSLIAHGQTHLFDGWSSSSLSENDSSSSSSSSNKLSLMAQLRVLDDAYPGGLVAYITNAQRLLSESRLGTNPLEGYTPSVPSGEALPWGSEKFEQFEERGFQHAASGKVAFVLVAGGLGERLGYSGIKVKLPYDTAREAAFLQLYCEHIAAYTSSYATTSTSASPKKTKHKTTSPFAIMTSDDTHAQTLNLLERNEYFGLGRDNITPVKQEKVACLADNDAKLALEDNNRWSVQTKPHGHGDVHMLMHSSGLLDEWERRGIEHVVFFQDTNALVFRAVPAAIGVSLANDFEVNSLAVPRRAKEAIGAITRLTPAQGSKNRAMTINVEYNQLDPLLRASGGAFKDGDMNDKYTGYSPFPGNINQLVFRLAEYRRTLQRTHGVIAEFINPKYTDGTKTAFKKPTRLECMMQDYPKSLGPEAKVGFTTITPNLAAYSPVKNSVAEAQAKFAKGDPTHSATSGELDVYASHCAALRLVGCSVGSPMSVTFLGMERLALPPRISFAPSFAPSLGHLRSKLPAPRQVAISARSSFVLEGHCENVILESLELDGALHISVHHPRCRLVIRCGLVQNAGWHWTPLEELEGAETSTSPVTEEEAMRGFRVHRTETARYEFFHGGRYVLE